MTGVCREQVCVLGSSGKVVSRTCLREVSGSYLATLSNILRRESTGV